MTSIDELARRAGSAVRDQARSLGDERPGIEQVARRHDRRATATVSVSAAAVVIVAVAAAGLLADTGPRDIDISEPVAPPSEPLATPPPTATEPPASSEEAIELGPEDGPVLLPAGWSEAELPSEVAAGEADAVAATGGPGVFAYGRDLLVTDSIAWSIHQDLLPAAPDVLAVGDPGGDKWVLAATGSTVTVYDRDLQPRHVADVPLTQGRSLLGAAWNGAGFILVAPASSRDSGNATYLVDVQSGELTELGTAPLSANRPSNSSVVATDDAVLLVGVWLDPDSNAPSRPTLGAAALPHGSTNWDVVPGGVLSPQSADAVSVRDYVLVVDYDGRAAQLDAIGWGNPVETGLADGECGPQLTLGNGPVLATKCLQVAAYDLSTGGWERIAGPTRAGGVSLGQPVGGIGQGFLVPTVEWRGTTLVASDFLYVEPAEAWPLVAGHDGPRLASPPGWQIATEDLTPNLVATTVTASTAAMPTGGDNCAQIPDAATEALGPSDALVHVQLAPDHQPDRTMPSIGSIEELRDEWTETSLTGCPANTDELVLYWIPARWGPEQIYVLIAHHRDAPTDVIEQALLVANSFTSG